MTKKVEIIPIAERKFKRRGIKREWIEDTIANPTQTVKGYGGRKVAHKKISIGGKEYLLRVVYEETEKNVYSNNCISNIAGCSLLEGGKK